MADVCAARRRLQKGIPLTSDLLSLMLPTFLFTQDFIIVLIDARLSECITYKVNKFLLGIISCSA